VAVENRDLAPLVGLVALMAAGAAELPILLAVMVGPVLLAL
jgi:hypothetical protein